MCSFLLKINKGVYCDVCVCVFCHLISFGRRTYERTSRGHTGGRSHRRKVTQDFSTFFLRCLPSFLSREGFSRPFPSSTVKSNFVYPRINRSPLVGHDFFIFYFLFFVKIPVRVTAPRLELTSQRQRVSTLPIQPPGRLANVRIGK